MWFQNNPNAQYLLLKMIETWTKFGQRRKDGGNTDGPLKGF